MKKSLILTLCIVLCTCMALGGTMAYLTSTDSDVNVMTLGNVKIEQFEYERVQKADGKYEMVTSAKYGEGYKLQPFTQGKPLYPATGAITGWGTKVPFDQLGSGASGAQAVFAGLNNVQDKFVLVKNTGKSDAYVRTIIALEEGSNQKDIIGISTGDFWTWNEIGLAEIDSNNYSLYEAIYKGSDVRHLNGILPAGEYTYNSLGQIYMMPEATNEDVEALDGNKNGTYDVLVFSQAVQTAGFETAEAALDAAFGDITTTNHPWKDGVSIPTITEVSTLEELEEVFAEGGIAKLIEDVTIDNMIKLENGVEVTLDMNGKTINFTRDASFTPGNPMFYPLAGTKLTITGNGTVDLDDNFDTALFCPAGEVVIENGTFIRDRVPAGTDPEDVQTMFIGVKSAGASVVINGGYFDGGYYDTNADAAFSETTADVANRGTSADKNLYRTAIKNNTIRLLNLSGTQDFRVYGGTFVGMNPAWGDEGCALPTTPEYKRPWSYYHGTFLDGQKTYDDKIELPAGYSITEGTTTDGRPTFTVNYSK